MAKARTKEESEKLASGKIESHDRLEAFAKSANADTPKSQERGTGEKSMIRVNFYLDADLHELIKEAAKSRRTKFSQQLRDVIVDGMEAKGLLKEMTSSFEQ